MNTASPDIVQLVNKLAAKSVAPLDLLPHDDLREKLINIVLHGETVAQNTGAQRFFAEFSSAIGEKSVADVRVVVFGGGSGLSNIVGGDSCSSRWVANPFQGLKEVFPLTQSIVCITDDGGSSGELLKELPLIAVGDIRHVLLSSIQQAILQNTYALSVEEALQVVALLSALFNYRFTVLPCGIEEVFAVACKEVAALPQELYQLLKELLEIVFVDPRLSGIVTRPGCLGNFLVIAAIYRHVGPEFSNDDLAAHPQPLYQAISAGLAELAQTMGAPPRSVLPCTATPSQLRTVYSNGVAITGESKLSHVARGVPVEEVHVDYCGEPYVSSGVLEQIRNADILVFAPGSLYSSIIPVLKIPGVAEAVRGNSKALKVLVANLWVQAGETDRSLVDPERKFRVSDMLRAYEQNIPGGTQGLFSEILCVSLQDIPGSILQNYAVEGKIPIYLDRSVVRKQGYIPVECDIFSDIALKERQVLQHDPATLARVVKVLYGVSCCFDRSQDPVQTTFYPNGQENVSVYNKMPSVRYQKISKAFSEMTWLWDSSQEQTQQMIAIFTDIIWRHHDIPLEHLDAVKKIHIVSVDNWLRDQRWDSVFSFYAPKEKAVSIRADQLATEKALETSLLVALGQSLLGDYVREKCVTEVIIAGCCRGKMYDLVLREDGERTSYFDDKQLARYLKLARMHPGTKSNHYTRLVNGDENFTPPGVLMGLLYAWYLDNTLATHIDYKMAILKIPQADLIPEQKNMVARRREMIAFFREVVFARR